MAPQYSILRAMAFSGVTLLLLLLLLRQHTFIMVGIAEGGREFVAGFVFGN